MRAESLVPYGPLDRVIHKVAFASLDMQRALGEIENRVCAGRFDPQAHRRPVFVTSLPRAGTTVMLEILAGQPELAAATYRQMPFTLAPLLWGDLSGRFRRASAMRERMHGDGLEVGFDSPEAFEEMIWMAFWPEHYGRESIQPWAADAAHPEFEGFLRAHMAKIVAAKGRASRRYLSKNNANIARLGLLERLFPDATLLVPVRNPWAQVASLHRQHRRFQALHERERFALRYMEGIGHFEFGEALRPIAFAQAPPDRALADGVEFWLRYWIEAYEAILRTAGSRVLFVDHDGLSRKPEAVLPAVAAALDLADPLPLLATAGRFRPPADMAPPAAPGPLLERAAELHATLLERCIAPGRTQVEVAW